MTKGEKSDWQVLGLKPGAEPDEIKSAFRKKALELHPDRGGTDEEFMAVQGAAQALLSRIDWDSLKKIVDINTGTIYDVENLTSETEGGITTRNLTLIRINPKRLK